MKILLVENDTRVATFIKRGLTENGMFVDWAKDGETGELLANDNDYELIILDILLSKLSGLDLCKKIRRIDTTTPILLLSALGTIEDKVNGLNSGADDYLVKPFDFSELIARILALTRRSYNLSSNQLLSIADLEVNLASKTVVRAGQEIELTAREFNLLVFLLRNKERVVGRTELEEKVWGIISDRDSNVVDVYINFLRKKIDKDYNPKLIHTLVGMGYVIKVKATR